MTIHSLWTTAASRYAELPALGWVEGDPWTFFDVDQRVQHLQRTWKTLPPRSRVALWSPNHPGWGVAYLAVVTGPWTVVPVLPDFTANEVANILHHAEVDLLIAGKALAETWKSWLETAPETLRRAVGGIEVLELEDLVEAPEGTPTALDLGLERPAEQDLAALIYTSGTTGASKGVMLTHANIASNVTSSSPIVGFEPGEVMLSVLPLAHTYECTLGLLVPLHEGVSVRYLNKPASPTVLLPALNVVRPHAMLTVPLFMEKIYRSKVKPLLTHGLGGLLSKIPGLGLLLTKAAGRKLEKVFGGRLKFFGIGGAPLAPEVARFLYRSGFPYAIGYGLTETSPLVAGHRGGRLYTTGRVLTGVEVRIGSPRNEQGAGEILVKGPNVMVGYYKDPIRTSEVIDADGWFHTGDLGRFDAAEHLTIMGRSKNLILGPSGENIYPEAIEALLNQDNRIVESLVLQRGTQIVAKVVVNHEQLAPTMVAAYLEHLKEQINSQLARFSRLSHVELQTEPFEKTPTLKIKRYLYA